MHLYRVPLQIWRLELLKLRGAFAPDLLAELFSFQKKNLTIAHRLRVFTGYLLGKFPRYHVSDEMMHDDTAAVYLQGTFSKKSDPVAFLTK